MEQIIIKNLWKSYDSLTVLKNVDLTLNRDQTYCLMSPSGTGKTTLFRILMGLEKADEGEIVWNASSGSGFGSDRDVSRPLRISPVFQEDRLCPTFSPLENVMMVQKGKSSDFSMENNRDRQRITKVMKWIRTNYREPLTLDQASGSLAVSREYFCRLFKKYTGQTFLEYLNDVRTMQLAKELIQSDDTITVLMEKHGLTNYKVFLRTFHKLYGMSPQKYRTS